MCGLAPTECFNFLKKLAIENMSDSTITKVLPVFEEFFQSEIFTAHGSMSQNPRILKLLTTLKMNVFKISVFYSSYRKNIYTSPK